MPRLGAWREWRGGDGMAPTIPRPTLVQVTLSTACVASEGDPFGGLYYRTRENMPSTHHKLSSLAVDTLFTRVTVIPVSDTNDRQSTDPEVACTNDISGNQSLGNAPPRPNLTLFKTHTSTRVEHHTKLPAHAKPLSPRFRGARGERARSSPVRIATLQ